MHIYIMRKEHFVDMRLLCSCVLRHCNQALLVSECVSENTGVLGRTSDACAGIIDFGICLASSVVTPSFNRPLHAAWQKFGLK